MSAYYLARLQLDVDTQDPKTRESFSNEVFTRSIALTFWSRVEVLPAASESDLALRIDQVIRDTFVARIANDLLRPEGDILGVEAFSKNPWDTGSGGIHEGEAPIVRVWCKGEAKLVDWKFLKAFVRASCSWIAL